MDNLTLTKRELLAAMAMLGLLASDHNYASVPPETIARLSIEHANALIKRLNKWGVDGRITD